ncbi:MAG: efflux RND transporter permease subunit [Gammaproteobacteria bacterium]|nr:efflux RND transporter permease subunit [Gammaproteobacteria bacterium]MBV9620824.1 efflux RND transporter permease subunit [Gammaproteobacteria bacterium]
MIDRFVAFCLQHRRPIFVLALLLAGFGVYAWETLSVEAYPELGDVAAQVTTQMPGLAAEEVEQLITVPLERQINGTPGLLLMRSSSTFGLSLITVLFRDGSEDYWARQRLLERINQAVLPAGASPTLDPVTGPGGEIYRYTLESNAKNLQELSEIQRWRVIPALKSVNGVVDVANFGGFTTEYQLNLEPRQLEHYGLGIGDVINALNSNNANAGGGRVSLGEQSYVIRGVGLLHTLQDVENTVVTQINGAPVLVRDLGRATLSHQEREGILGKDANPDTIEGIVLMLKYQNPSHTLRGVHAKVAELNRVLAREGVRIAPYIDRDQLVQMTVHKVGRTIAEGIGLVFIVLIVFLGSPRSAFVVAVSIPMALVSVFSFLNLTKVSANLLSLGALDFGILVDGAIVVTEAVLRRREATPAAELSESEVRAAALQVTRPIFFASLIIITTYMPLFSFERAEAKLFTPMAYTMAYALFGALLTTLALVPGLAYYAYRKPRAVYTNRWLERLTGFYDRLLAVCLREPPVVYGITLFALLAVVGFGATIGRDFLPDLDEGALWLQVQMPTGLALNQASDMASALRRAILKHPEVAYVLTQTGRNDDGTDSWTMSHVEAPVGLRPYDSWPAGESKKDFVDRLAQDLARELPGFAVGISQPIIDGVNDMIGGAHSPLVVKIYGDDLNELREIGRQIVAVLYEIRGTSSASIFQEPPVPQVEIRLDRERAARYGINMSDVQNVIQTGVGQAPVSTVYVGERTYPLTVRYNAVSRSDPDSLGDLPVRGASGQQIPLSQVASVRVRSGESTVTRENGKRNLTIRIDNRDRDLTSYLQEAQRRIARQVHFDPARIRLEWGGQFENQRRAESRLLVILAMVMGMMLILLTVGVGSLRQAALILSVVPLATLGGLVALHLTGQTLNVATGVGFIALFGVAVQNGIIMVANLNRMRKAGYELHEAVMRGATERLRPVLMTATVATLGMLPAALHTGVGSDVQRGIATVVVGGLAVATLLTLIVLPSLYHTMEHWAEERGTRLPWNR